MKNKFFINFIIFLFLVNEIQSGGTEITKNEALSFLGGCALAGGCFFWAYNRKKNREFENIIKLKDQEKNSLQEENLKLTNSLKEKLSQLESYKKKLEKKNIDLDFYKEIFLNQQKIIDEPTMFMYFSVNDSPFSGKEGKLLTSIQICERLMRELRINFALRVEHGESTDSFKVFGRDHLHLGVLIEEMRREGFELQISSPEIINKVIDGVKCEPVERLFVDILSEHRGAVIQMLENKKAEMKNMEPYGTGGRVRIEFEVPSRGLLGFKSQFLTETRYTGIAEFSFHGYVPFKGEIPSRIKGALVSLEQGPVTGYALNTIQERGTLFVKPQEVVYKGQIIGENSSDDDLAVNACNTNMGASGSDDSVKIDPPKIMSLQACMEWITKGEYIEVTPTSIRLRKKFYIKTNK